jgi:amino acid adenylation domain-containing protein
VSLDLIERFAEHVRTSPEAVAVEAQGLELSYRALYRRAAAVARALHEAGCGPADRIAVWTGDRAALVSVMLGVLYTGAVFVPLHEDASGERLRQRLARLQPRALLHDALTAAAARQHLGDAGDRACSLVAIPDDDGVLPEDHAAIAPLESGAPAYVYFTSGSTGRPKGIIGTRAALAQRVAWEIDTFCVRPGTRCSQLVTPTFDPWFRDIFVPLCAGGRIVIPPQPPARLEPERLLEWLRDARIEFMHCGPSLMTALVSAPARIRRLPELRTVLSSGETLHVSLVRRWRRRFGTEVELVNLYGATEATMAQFYHRVEVCDTTRTFVPVGRPLPGVKVQLLDRAGRPCALGETGEILVGGPSLSLGYFDDQTATERSFERRGQDGSEVYYRTGDLGVEYQPGCYRLLGRIDDQVKIRGVRVEPREVEDALIGYPLIATCAVVARPDRAGETSLIAYIVPETQYPPAIAEIRAYLRERLPPQYLPAAFVILPALPLSANGKIDRQRLPDPGRASAPLAGGAARPRNALEAALASHWCAILGLPEIGVTEDFLDLGGHSLSAMRLSSAVSEAGVGELSLREIFEHRTIAGQAALLHARSTAVAHDGTEAQPVRAEAPVGRASPTAAGFDCPPGGSADIGGRRCNLVIVIGPDVDRDSFERVAQIVTAMDDRIGTRVVDDVPGWEAGLPPLSTLIVAPALLRHRPAIPAHVCCGYPLSKSEEYRILERAGISVPMWAVLEDGVQPDLSRFGAYVVRKPDYGAKGAEVRIARRDRVRWKPVVTSAAGPSPRLLVQEFVYTGLWPVSYRVNTLFGRTLYSMVITGNRARPALGGPDEFAAQRSSGGQCVSIVSNARDSTAEFCMDESIIAFGERAAAAFPDVPLLGVDILKDAMTGRLLVSEVNSLGHNWNFGPDFATAFRLDIERQFDGLRKAASILAEETRLRAGVLRD